MTNTAKEAPLRISARPGSSHADHHLRRRVHRRSRPHRTSSSELPGQSTGLCSEEASDTDGGDIYLAPGIISDYAYHVRNRLRREVLVALRKVLELQEVYMSAGKWDEMPYARVASLAMRQYKQAFLKSGVAGFFDKVRTGHARMPVDAVMPHEIVAATLKGEHDESA